MDIPKGIIDITENNSSGFHKLVHFESWCVSILNETQDDIDVFDSFEYHALSDEVFILIKGKGSLFVSKGNSKPEHIYKIIMEPLKCYNVKKGIWHNLVLSAGSSAMIVENNNTSTENSVYYKLSNEELNMIELT